MISKPLIKYVMTAAIRDKLVMTLLLMIGLSAAVAVFLGSSAITEEDTFSLVFGASGLRFLNVLGLVLFCSFYMRRSFDLKEVEFLLSRPISRMTFLISHALAFILLALVVTAITTGAMFFLGRPDPSGLMMWGLSIAIENSIMSVTALFFSIVISSAAGSALAALGFYALTRLIGTLLGIASQAPEKMVFAIMNNVMEVISVIIPRLDMMAQSSWLVYGVEGSAGIGFQHQAGPYAHAMIETLGVGGFIGVQGVVFIALLLAASAYDFVRRQF